MDTINIKNYLTEKGISYIEHNGELIAHCFFNNCDTDSSPKEGHLYFNADTGQYQCKKCNEIGNIVTLKRYFGDIGKSKPSIDDIIIKNKIIPDNIRTYLNNRGITDELIETHRIGFGNFYKKQWIIIPVPDETGKIITLKLRKNPYDHEQKPKYLHYPSTGNKTTLYGIENLKNETDLIVICEGELDQIIASAQGIPAISSTGGCSTFKDEWITKLEPISKIYICLDNDKAGTDASKELANKILEQHPEKQVYITTLPQMKDGKDITDYFVFNRGNVDDFFNEFSSLVTKETISRVIAITSKYKDISFHEWNHKIANNFANLAFPAEIAASVLTQTLINDITNPFGVVFVGMPAAGKTITLNFFSDIEGLTFCTDKFTPASFVSNATNVKKEELKDIDLLPKIKNKGFIVRDMATLFSKREDDLNESLGLLTRIFDGEGLAVDSGVYGHREYKGDYFFTFLAASTPIPPKVWKMMGNLGSRLFFYNIVSPKKTEDDLKLQLQNNPHKQKEVSCRNITKDFLFSLWSKHPNGIDWDRNKDSEGVIEVIVRCSLLLSNLRGVVNMWKETDGSEVVYSYTQPIIEQPDRLNQLFYNLARGHAVVQGRNYLTLEDIKPVISLALQSADSIRTLLFNNLLKRGGVMKTTQVEQVLNCSKPTALKEMQTLKILGLCTISDEPLSGYQGNAEKELVLNEEYRWFTSEEYKNLIA